MIILKKKIFKFLLIFLIILGISFSNASFYLVSTMIDSYIGTRGIVDKLWLVQQKDDPNIVDKFASLRDLPEKLRIHDALAASTYINVAHYNSASSASAACSKPTNTADNDIMFAVVMRNVAAAPTTVPAGWTELGNHTNGVYQQRLYWKLAASEGASYTWAWAAAASTAITIATYRGGFDTSSPIDVVSNTEYVVSSTADRAATMNVTSANSTLVYVGTVYRTTAITYKNLLYQILIGWKTMMAEQPHLTFIENLPV